MASAGASDGSTRSAQAVPTSNDVDVGRCLQAIRALSGSIARQVRSLSPEQWTTITNCSPWQVRDLAAHLVTSGEGFAQSIERGLSGTVEPPSAAGRERRQEALIEAGPAAVADALDQITDRFEGLFRGLDTAGLSTVAFHRRGNRPVRWFAAHRLAEISFHGWDLQRSLGQDAVYSEDVARLLLPTLLESNAPRTYAAGLSAERGTGERFLLAVADDPSARWLVTIGPDRLDAERSDAPADVTITGPAAALALLIYGRDELADLASAGVVRVEGEAAVAARFGSIFPRP